MQVVKKCVVGLIKCETHFKKTSLLRCLLVLRLVLVANSVDLLIFFVMLLVYRYESYLQQTSVLVSMLLLRLMLIPNKCFVGF